LSALILWTNADTMKIRLATQNRLAPQFNGLLDCFRNTWRREGFRGFYAGVFSPLCGQMFLNATQFFAWGQSSALVTRTVHRVQQDFTPRDFAMAGLFTAVACALVENPIDFFKTQLQVQIFNNRNNASHHHATLPTAAAATLTQPQFHTVPQCVKYVLSTSGIRGAYQGLSATLIRNLPFRSSYFATYEYTRAFLLRGKRVTRDATPGWVQLASGGMAGLTQWFVCYPLDAIKSNMQADAILRHERKYKGWLHCVRTMYGAGGIQMFFRGWTPCMLRSFPANAVCYYFYETTVRLLQPI